MAVIVSSVTPIQPDFDYPPRLSHNIDIDLGVVAAVVGAAADLESPSSTPEYRLVNANKRKNPADDDADNVPYGHVAKRPKQDDPSEHEPLQQQQLLVEHAEYGPSLLSSLTFLSLSLYSLLSFCSSSSPAVEPTPSQEQRFNVTVEEAIAAILSLPTIQQACASPLPLPDQQLQQQSPQSSSYLDANEPLLPPSDLAPALPGAPLSLLPPEDPVPALDTRSQLFFEPEILHEEDEEEVFPIQFRHTPPRVSIPRQRIPPLWKVACKSRVEHLYVAIRMFL